MLERRLRQYVSLNIGLACLQFLLILCIPFVNIEGNMSQRIIAYLTAGIFWISIIGEILLIVCSANARSGLEQKMYKNKEIENSLPGIFSFFKNKEAAIADIGLFIFVLLLGIIIRLHIKTSWMIIGIVSTVLLLFNLHCILNGKNYRYIKEYKNNMKEKKKDE